MIVYLNELIKNSLQKQKLYTITKKKKGILHNKIGFEYYIKSFKSFMTCYYVVDGSNEGAFVYI